MGRQRFVALQPLAEAAIQDLGQGVDLGRVK
jgi:hypothetical protein